MEKSSYLHWIYNRVIQWIEYTWQQEQMNDWACTMACWGYFFMVDLSVKCQKILVSSSHSVISFYAYDTLSTLSYDIHWCWFFRSWLHASFNIKYTISHTSSIECHQWQQHCWHNNMVDFSQFVFNYTGSKWKKNLVELYQF